MCFIECNLHVLAQVTNDFVLVIEHLVQPGLHSHPQLMLLLHSLIQIINLLRHVGHDLLQVLEIDCVPRFEQFELVLQLGMRLSEHVLEARLELLVVLRMLLMVLLIHGIYCLLHSLVPRFSGHLVCFEFIRESGMCLLHCSFDGVRITAEFRKFEFQRSMRLLKRQLEISTQFRAHLVELRLHSQAQLVFLLDSLIDLVDLFGHVGQNLAHVFEAACPTVAELLQLFLQLAMR
mmetsp:Transcript_28383/g.53266  ORF Transcript_28383/g.53266 Transcript_28383/m.53266 type:complete len:234 (-) Transcript_28383:38-739(-)